MRKTVLLKGLFCLLLMIILNVTSLGCSSLVNKTDEENSSSTELSKSDNKTEQGGTDQPIPSSLTKQSFTANDENVFSYWLYTPTGATENMPLLIYLHGGSGKEDDLDIY